MARLEHRGGALEGVLSPPAITVVGASARTMYTRALIANLRRPESSFAGPIHLVNRRNQEIDGIATVPSLDAVPGDLGLLFLLVAAHQCKDVLSGIESTPTAVIVAASGFAEAGNVEDQAFVQTWCAERGVPLIGPNCLGVIAPRRNLLA